MKLLKRIKLNYNLKLFQDYISSKNFNDAFNFIQDLNKKDKIDFFLLLKNSQELLTKLPQEFYQRKIIWTISYDLSDVSYINNFLNFYLSRNLNSSFTIDNFSNSLNQYFTNLDSKSQVKDIEFNDYLTQSNLYQNLLLFNSDKDFLFLNSCASFFETSQKNYFIHPNITFCYFYVIKRPESLLSKYKKKHDTSEAAYDELFNFREQQYLDEEQDKSNFKVYENRKNYNINVKSWTDENVVNTFKGKIISFDRLLNDTENTLLEILYHLKQYKLPVDINIDDIKSFILNYELNTTADGELSNNDKKFLQKNLDSAFDY